MGEDEPSALVKPAPMSSDYGQPRNHKPPCPNIASLSIAGATGQARAVADVGFSASGIPESANDSEVNALQEHVDHVCTELAICLNNAIQLARRSADRGKATSCNL